MFWPEGDERALSKRLREAEEEGRKHKHVARNLGVAVGARARHQVSGSIVAFVACSSQRGGYRVLVAARRAAAG